MTVTFTSSSRPFHCIKWYQVYARRVSFVDVLSDAMHIEPESTDWFWVSCSIVFVPLYCAAFVKWAQAKPPHTVVCWCFVGSRFVQVGQMSEMHVKDIERLHLKEFVLNDLYTNVSNFVIWTWFVNSVWKGCSGRHRLSWSSYWLVRCPVMCQGWENINGMQSVVFRVLRVVFIFLKNHSKYLQVLRTCKLFDSWARLRLPRSTGIDSARGLSCGLLFLVGQAMETWKHGKTLERRKDLRLFQLWLPSGGHCWVLGWSDQSGRLSLRQSQENGWESLKSWAVWTQRCTSQTYQTQNSSKLGVPTGFSRSRKKKVTVLLVYGFHVELSTQRRSWRNPRNLRALKVLVLLLLSSPWVTSPVEFDARTTILM